MFKHLLVPTDGSPASEAAIQKSIEFAKLINARVTGLHVIPVFQVFTYQTEMLEDTREQFDEENRVHAAQFLAFIEHAAREAGVACNTVSVKSEHPYEAILQMAEDQGVRPDCHGVARQERRQRIPPGQ